MKKRRNPAIIGWHERTRRAGYHGGDRTVCAVAKRAHPFGEYFVLPAGLAQRPAEGRESDLRIEDLDIARCPRRYGEQMCRDIQWLGLDWDEGPVIGGPSGPYEQSRRTALYQAALRRLEAQGLVYPCFCTRAELHGRQCSPPGGWTGGLPGGPAAV